jgi:hypothetical protein
MNIFLRKSASPYTVLSNNGVKNVAKIAAGRRDYEYVFTPKNSETTAVLMWELNGSTHSFWLDNIKVYEADAVLTNPDDSIRFVHNTSSVIKTIALGAKYVDAIGSTFSSSISLAPYTSAILVKTAPNANPQVNITSPIASAQFRVKDSIRLTATATDMDGSISKVEFYNDSTLIQTISVAPYDWTWTNVAAGTYTITAKAYDNDGAITTSAPIAFIVEPNQAPQTALTSPIDYAVY